MVRIVTKLNIKGVSKNVEEVTFHDIYSEVSRYIFSAYYTVINVYV